MAACLVVASLVAQASAVGDGAADGERGQGAGEKLAIDPVLIFMVLSVLGNVVACMRVFCVRRPQERGGTTPPKRERARADEPGDAVKAKLMKCTRDQLEQLAYAVGYTKDSSRITKTVLMEMILAKGGGQSEEDQARWVHDMLLGIE